jgi:hypothetical protein
MRVIQSQENNIINTFSSVTDASKKLNIKRDLILRCCQGKQKSAKGYNFNYDGIRQN